MKISLVSDLEAWRKQARAKVDAHFNDLALRTLHEDLCQIARCGVSQSVLLRDRQKRELLLRIDDAGSPAQIEEIISTL
jgi:hypothetical protein